MVKNFGGVNVGSGRVGARRVGSGRVASGRAGRSGVRAGFCPHPFTLTRMLYPPKDPRMTSTAHRLRGFDTASQGKREPPQPCGK